MAPSQSDLRAEELHGCWESSRERGPSGVYAGRHQAEGLQQLDIHCPLSGIGLCQMDRLVPYLYKNLYGEINYIKESSQELRWTCSLLDRFCIVHRGKTEETWREGKEEESRQTPP